MHNMNTVIASQTSNTVTTRVRMILAHPIYKNRVLIIVEGNDDKKVYGRLFNKEKVNVYPLGGCCHYEALLTTLNPMYYPRFAVIKDADFEHIVGYEYNFPNLFRTDTHDAETMMMTDAFYESFKMEFLDGKDDVLAEMMKVHDEMMPLSWFKLACKEMNKKIKFDSFSLYNFYKGDSAVDVEVCRKVLSKIPENVSIGIPTDSDIDGIKKKYGFVDKNKLNNGHDLCAGFAYKYKSLGNKNEIKIETLEKVLRTAFTMKQFQQTTLYSDMVAWADKEGLNFLRAI